MTSRRRNNGRATLSTRSKKAPRLLLAPVVASFVIVAIVFSVLYISDRPVVADLAILQPLPDSLELVDSWVEGNHGGGRVPADSYVVLRTTAEGDSSRSLDVLVEHLGNRGWSGPQSATWGWLAKHPDGPVGEFGHLEDYLSQANSSGRAFENEALLPRLSDFQGERFLLLVLSP